MLTYDYRWRKPENKYRKIWNVNNVPTIVRYSFVDGEVKETGRLLEGELLQEKRLSALISNK